VNLLLVVMTIICKRIEEPTTILGYADNWVIYTIQRTSAQMDQNKIQKAATVIVK
jgi:hypothetical protein